MQQEHLNGTNLYHILQRTNNVSSYPNPILQAYKMAFKQLAYSAVYWNNDWPAVYSPHKMFLA